MKYKKQVKPFFFKGYTIEEICDIVNSDLPIKLNHNSDLVERIYNKYPYISKTEISLILKTIFESLRELLICGKVLNFNNIFFDTKFHFFKHIKNGAICPSLKVKITTPPYLTNKGNNYD